MRLRLLRTLLRLGIDMLHGSAQNTGMKTTAADTYQVVLYRDTETDAAFEQRVLPDVYATVEHAITEARAAFQGEWRTATVHEGWWRQRKVNGRVQYEFEDGEAVRWYVGPDYADREETS